MDKRRHSTPREIENFGGFVDVHLEEEFSVEFSDPKDAFRFDGSCGSPEPNGDDLVAQGREVTAFALRMTASRFARLVHVHFKDVLHVAREGREAVATPKLEPKHLGHSAIEVGGGLGFRSGSGGGGVQSLRIVTEHNSSVSVGDSGDQKHRAGIVDPRPTWWTLRTKALVITSSETLKVGGKALSVALAFFSTSDLSRLGLWALFGHDCAFGFRLEARQSPLRGSVVRIERERTLVSLSSAVSVAGGSKRMSQTREEAGAPRAERNGPLVRLDSTIVVALPRSRGAETRPRTSMTRVEGGRP